MPFVQPVADVEETPLEETEDRRRRCWRFGLGVVWAFALVFLSYGLIDWLAAPAEDRTNNGRHATFFAVHISPYFEFSEDFHLYSVRAKRVRDRGWTDSPLYETPDSKPSYAAPLQVLLMQAAVLTDGRPIPYAAFMTTVLAVAWTVLYVAAARWMHPSVSPLTVPIALCFTVCFESIDGLFNPIGEYGQWPVHRGLRMATLAWSNPLLLSLTIAATSLLVRPAKPAGRAVFIGVILAVFAAGDPWSFLITGGILASLMAVQIVVAATLAWRNQTGVRERLVVVGLVGCAGLVGLAVQRVFGLSLSGDSLTRAGFGPEWLHAIWGAGESRWLWHNSRTLPWEAFRVFVLTTLYGGVRFSRRRRRAFGGLRLGWPTERRQQWLALALLPTAGILVLGASLTLMGVEAYHLMQFVWRIEYIHLFCLILLLSENAKLLIRHFSKRAGVKSYPWEFAGAAALLLTLWCYHVGRTFDFIIRIPAKEFFLTEDEEELRDWLRSRKPARREVLATTSHELNYLCAYWTDADLLLPEGFPYHNVESQKAIESRVARLLAVYRVTPRRWLEFTLHRHGSDQWSWAISRLLSARQGYMYYLMHRAVAVAGSLKPGFRSKYYELSTKRLADERYNHELRVLDGSYATFKTGYLSAKKIAVLLADHPPLAPEQLPDVILVDETSRYLGTPDFTNYDRQFRHGGLEAWVKK
jgi:hypothetical protein